MGGSMEPWISKYKKNTDDIMKDMPDSPSMSDLSSIQTPIVQADTLILASDLTTRSRGTSKNSKYSQGTRDKKSKPRSAKGTRHSKENVTFPNTEKGNNDEYELKQIEDEIIRYNDPGPNHPSKKYPGFVNKSVNRMDTTGHLPTPSKSENTDEQFSQSFMEEIENQKRGIDQQTYAVQQLQIYQQSANKRGSNKKVISPGLPPRPPPIPTTHDNDDQDNDDSGEYYDDDDDLKQSENIGMTGLPPPTYDEDDDDDDHDLQHRDRGFSNLSGSQSNSGVGSLNSKDSSDISSMSKSKPKSPKKKKKQIIVETDYNPDKPLISVSSSQATSGTGTTTETDTDQKEKDTPIKKKKKKKKKKAPKPKVKSPFFASDAAISKGKDDKTSPKSKKKKTSPKSKSKGKDTKSGKKSGKTTSTTTGKAALKSTKSSKGLKSAKSDKDKKKTSPKSKSKNNGKDKGKSTSTAKSKSKTKSGKKGTDSSRGMLSGHIYINSI